MNEGGFSTRIFIKHEPIHECGLCLQVLNDPVQCRNGHRFCLGCIKDSLEKYLFCPECTIPTWGINSYGKCLIMSHLIDNLESRCHILPVEQGKQHCEWTGPFHQRKAHVLTCSFNKNIDWASAQYTEKVDIKRLKKRSDRSFWCWMLIFSVSGLVLGVFVCMVPTLVFSGRSSLSEHRNDASQAPIAKSPDVRLGDLKTDVVDSEEINDNIVVEILQEYNQTALPNTHEDIEIVPMAREQFNVDGSVTRSKDRECKIDNGFRLCGVWKDGLLNGFGTKTTADGHRVYEGNWVDGVAHGRGNIHEGTRSCEGLFINGTLEGEVTCSWTDGLHSVGLWRNGHMHGENRLMLEGIYDFTADFVYGQPKNGTCVYSKGHIVVVDAFDGYSSRLTNLTSGRYTRAIFDDGAFTPLDLLVMQPNDDNHVKNDLHSSIMTEIRSEYVQAGISTENNKIKFLADENAAVRINEIFQRELQKAFTRWNKTECVPNEVGVIFCGKRKGTVIKKINDRIVYLGEYLRGYAHGRGIMFNEYGVYDGDFRNDRKQGFGSFYFLDGQVVEGHWKNNQMFGTGSITTSEFVFTGTFENSSPQNGTYVYRNLDSFTQFSFDGFSDVEGVYVEHETGRVSRRKLINGQFVMIDEQGEGVLQR